MIGSISSVRWLILLAFRVWSIFVGGPNGCPLSSTYRGGWSVAVLLNVQAFICLEIGSCNPDKKMAYLSYAA